MAPQGPQSVSASWGRHADPDSLGPPPPEPLPGTAAFKPLLLTATGESNAPARLRISEGFAGSVKFRFLCLSVFASGFNFRCGLKPGGSLPGGSLDRPPRQELGRLHPGGCCHCSHELQPPHGRLVLHSFGIWQGCCGVAVSLWIVRESCSQLRPLSVTYHYS